jgi:ribosomal protein S18 acetylase RimI-like enzyme
MVVIEPGRTDDADAVADCWVTLADGQREFGSHLLATENRETVREAIVRRAVADELLVARNETDEGNSEADELGDNADEIDNDDIDGTNPEDDGEIVGFVTFGVETGRYDLDATRGVVQNVFVVPERRDEGVGSGLLEAAERRLADAGTDVVTLEVMADNDAARRFYRRHGYSSHRVEMEKSVESDTLTKE